MRHSKMVVEDQEEVLVDLVEQIFQIFLRISLGILVVVEDQEIDDQITEVQTWDMIYQLLSRKLIMEKNKT